MDKIRYILSYDDDKRVKAVYSIEQLEDKDLIQMLYHLNNDNIKIVRRDLSTGMVDNFGIEVFENDNIITEGGERGYVKRAPGGFYLDDTPLGEITVKQVL